MAETVAESRPRTAPRAPAPAAEPSAVLFDTLGADTPAGATNDLDLVLDIPVQVTVELGRTRLPIARVLQLAPGSVVELDDLAGSPLDLYVNGCLIAQGEVVVVNDRFGIRVTDIVTPSERMRKVER